jgi:thiamine-phosphate pyrophosphorylase
MVIVISSPEPIENEAQIINALFDEGMELFHLRKPGDKKEHVRALLKEIKPEYYSKIALHQNHEMAAEFGITRLHYKKKVRRAVKEEELIKNKGKKYILSTSVHSLRSYSKLMQYFDYTFLGPVFDSISKTGYMSGFWKDMGITDEKGAIKMIAIGGISSGNMQRALDMGFDGVAVLGTIWKDPSKAVDNYKKLAEYAF